jgi:hypothetical protein
MTLSQTSLDRTRAFARAATVLAMLAAATPAAASSADWDIFGLRLGATEAEARTVLAGYDPNGKISAHESNYSYSDKVTRHRSPSFLDQLVLQVTKLAIHQPLRVWFSGPNEEVRVVAVTRQETNLPNPSTYADFRKSLEAKYGPPTGQAGSMLVWEEAGKPSCIRTSYGISLGEFPKLLMGHTTMDKAAASLDANKGQDPLPADLTTCGTVVFYGGGDPVTSFSGGLLDLGAIMKSFYGRNAWVAGLEAEAIRQREGQSQVPRL